MTDAPRQPSGFWNRLTRRTKILVLVDVIVLATLLVAAVLYVTDPWSDSSSETIATSDTTTLDGDLAGMRTAHRHATHVDDNGKHWLVVVEGDSDVPLEPLRRYGFRIG